jgi:GNAT superfamily N-acetyltransferase
LYDVLHPAESSSVEATVVQAVWQEILKDPRLHCFVLERSGAIVATAVLDIVPNLTRGCRPFGVLQNVVTDGSMQGTGLGKKLIGDVLAFAWEQNCYQVLVQTGRPDVVGFYEKLGFTSEKIGLVAKPH